MPWPSADQHTAAHADFSFQALVTAYFDCRQHKRNSDSARRFEQDLERNLHHLHAELLDGTYTPGPSICFVITRPKPREVWAADFRDRIVHHLLYNKIAPRFHRAFIANSCACIPGRGTLYAARRLEASVRSITQNWSRPAWYLKCDLANFFVSIDKPTLFELVARRVHEPWWRALAHQVLFHDPRVDAILQSTPALHAKVPSHKRLMDQPAHRGLPIGNLSSQFFANILLDVLDQHCKHHLQARHYVRYVDDFILLHESPQQLNAWLANITTFLPQRLKGEINPAKTIIQPVDRGIDFVGQVIKPWRRTLRRRTYNDALHRLKTMPDADVWTSANSYLGLLGQTTAGHHDRARMARVIMKRGHVVDGKFVKAFRRAA